MHLFTNICNVLVIWLAVFPVSQAYNGTGVTFVLNICILTRFDVVVSPHRIQLNKYTIRFLNSTPTSSSVPSFSDATLPRTCSQLFNKKAYLSTPWELVGGIEAWLHSLLNLALDGGGVIRLTRRPLYPVGKIFRYPFEQEAVWVAEQIWTFCGRDCSWRDSNTRSSIL